jgi:hypothetical protein
VDSVLGKVVSSGTKHFVSLVRFTTPVGRLTGGGREDPARPGVEEVVVNDSLALIRIRCN